jgi:hypothetical protein
MSCSPYARTTSIQCPHPHTNVGGGGEWGDHENNQMGPCVLSTFPLQTSAYLHSTGSNRSIWPYQLRYASFRVGYDKVHFNSFRDFILLNNRQAPKIRRKKIGYTLINFLSHTVHFLGWNCFQVILFLCTKTSFGVNIEKYNTRRAIISQHIKML